MMKNLFNDAKVKVSERIEKGLTKFVRTSKEARTLTLRSGYFYTVFNEKGERVGFGIPR